MCRMRAVSGGTWLFPKYPHAQKSLMHVVTTTNRRRDNTGICNKKFTMPVEIGINPLTWTNDDLPWLGAATPLATCLREGREAGFAGFELGNKFPRDAATLAPILDEHDLKLVSGWYSLRLLDRSVEEEIEAAQAHIDLMVALGCNAMVCCEVTDCVHGDRDTPVFERQPFPPASWDAFAEKLERFAAHVEDCGTSLAYHHHMGTVIQNTDEIDELMQRTDIGLLLDTGHVTYAGGDPVDVARRWAPRINHVHCKDVRPDVLADAHNRNLSFLDAALNGVFTVPGDGCVDYPAVFAVLKEAGYEGWLVVEAEQDMAIAHPPTYASMGYNNLSSFAREAALI